jgi:hypothetical protein
MWVVGIGSGAGVGGWYGLLNCGRGWELVGEKGERKSGFVGDLAS